jgi:hypothetical protein
VSIANGATPWTYTAAGQHITYAYTLTNDRNTRLTGLTVADSRLGDITRDCRKPASPSVPTWTVGQLHHHTDRRGQRQHHEQAGDERELPVRKAFSKAQRSLFGGQAPAGMELDDLVVLGPLNILKLKFAHQDYSRPMVVELWFYPDGSQILDLSAKCRPGPGVRRRGRNQGVPGQARRRSRCPADDQDQDGDVFLRIRTGRPLDCHRLNQVPPSAIVAAQAA